MDTFQPHLYQRVSDLRHPLDNSSPDGADPVSHFSDMSSTNPGTPASRSSSTAVQSQGIAPSDTAAPSAASAAASAAASQTRSEHPDAIPSSEDDPTEFTADETTEASPAAPMDPLSTPPLPPPPLSPLAPDIPMSSALELLPAATAGGTPAAQVASESPASSTNPTSAAASGFSAHRFQRRPDLSMFLNMRNLGRFVPKPSRQAAPAPASPSATHTPATNDLHPPGPRKLAQPSQILPISRVDSASNEPLASPGVYTPQTPFERANAGPFGGGFITPLGSPQADRAGLVGIGELASRLAGAPDQTNDLAAATPAATPSASNTTIVAHGTVHPDVGSPSWQPTQTHLESQRSQTSHEEGHTLPRQAFGRWHQREASGSQQVQRSTSISKRISTGMASGLVCASFDLRV